jgi:hypothetical protein
VWLALCFELSVIAKTKVDTDFTKWDDGWGFIFANLICSAVFKATGYEQNIQIIKALTEKKQDVQADKSTKTSPWSRSAWEMLVLLQPLSCNRDSFPGVLRDIMKNCERDVEAFTRWAGLVKLFLDSGASFDHPCRGFPKASPSRKARQFIEDGISLASQIQDLSRTDHQKVLQAIESLEKLLPAKPQRSQQTASRKATSRRVNNGEDGDSGSAVSGIEGLRTTSGIMATESKGLTRGSSQNSALHADIATAQPVAEAQQCFNCKAFKELASMGFTANQILEAVQKARVGSDTGALAAWIVKKDAKPRGTQPTKASSSTDVGRKQPMLENWSKVVSKKLQPAKQEIVGAMYADESKWKLKRGRKNKQSGEVIVGATAGVVPISHGTFSWSLDGQGALTPEQERQLNDFLESLLR